MPSAFEADHEAWMCDPVYAAAYRDEVQQIAGGGHCRDGCPEPGTHSNWGDCARAARIQIDREALKSHD